MKKMVVPTDGSVHSLHAVKVAKDLAQCSGMEIHLLNVQKKELPYQDFVQIGNEDKLESYLQELGKKIMKDSEAILSGIIHKVEVRIGDPAEEIIKYSKEVEADFIVMGSHGYTGIVDYFLGSVSTKVMTFSRIPVMITRDPDTLPKHPKNHPYLS